MIRFPEQNLPRYNILFCKRKFVSENAEIPSIAGNSLFLTHLPKKKTHLNLRNICMMNESMQTNHMRQMHYCGSSSYCVSWRRFIYSRRWWYRASKALKQQTNTWRDKQWEGFWSTTRTFHVPASVVPRFTRRRVLPEHLRLDTLLVHYQDR